MVTYGGMAKKPVTVSTSSFIFKVRTQLYIHWHSGDRNYHMQDIGHVAYEYSMLLT